MTMLYGSIVVKITIHIPVRILQFKNKTIMDSYYSNYYSGVRHCPVETHIRCDIFELWSLAAGFATFVEDVF